MIHRLGNGTGASGADIVSRSLRPKSARRAEQATRQRKELNRRFAAAIDDLVAAEE